MTESSATVANLRPVLSARAVSKVYRLRSQRFFGHTESRTALADVSAEVLPNETLAVIGDSGSGKTTLTRILLGLTPPSAGEVMFRGKSLSERGVRTALRASSGVIFQNPATSFDPRWTIERSIREPLDLQHPQWEETRKSEAVRAGLRAVDLDPDRYAERFPADLSGGQMQRAAFARAVVNRPAVLLADEPMSAIDMPTRLMVLDMLRTLHSAANAEGHEMATIIVSHDLGVVQHIADRVLVVHEGRVVESGETARILSHPGCDYTKRLIAAASL
jgi:peptide/nickel transport system ATP-binding protein